MPRECQNVGSGRESRGSLSERREPLRIPKKNGPITSRSRDSMNDILGNSRVHSLAYIRSRQRSQRRVRRPMSLIMRIIYMLGGTGDRGTTVNLGNITL